MRVRKCNGHGPSAPGGPKRRFFPDIIPNYPGAKLGRRDPSFLCAQMCSNKKQRPGKSNIGAQQQHQPQPIQIGCPGIKSQGPGGAPPNPAHPIHPRSAQSDRKWWDPRAKPQLHGSCRGIGRVSAKPEHEERKKDGEWTPPRVPPPTPSYSTCLSSPPSSSHVRTWVPPYARASLEHLHLLNDRAAGPNDIAKNGEREREPGLLS
jgi:hypothetical protein